MHGPGRRYAISATIDATYLIPTNHNTRIEWSVAMIQHLNVPREWSPRTMNMMVKPAKISMQRTCRARH
jgi:hypothetical protein